MDGGEGCFEDKGAEAAGAEFIELASFNFCGVGGAAFVFEGESEGGVIEGGA